jgi:hypothetical protein
VVDWIEITHCLDWGASASGGTSKRSLNRNGAGRTNTGSDGLYLEVAVHLSKFATGFLPSALAPTLRPLLQTIQLLHLLLQLHHPL